MRLCKCHRHLFYNHRELDAFNRFFFVTPIDCCNPFISLVPKKQTLVVATIVSVVERAEQRRAVYYDMLEPTSSQFTPAIYSSFVKGRLGLVGPKVGYRHNIQVTCCVLWIFHGRTGACLYKNALLHWFDFIVNFSENIVKMTKKKLEMEERWMRFGKILLLTQHLFYSCGWNLPLLNTMLDCLRVVCCTNIV